jgi:hypothetical protein
MIRPVRRYSGESGKRCPNSYAGISGRQRTRYFLKMKLFLKDKLLLRP